MSLHFRLALAAVLVLAPASATAATPVPHGPAVDTALAYMRARGAGDYVKAFALLSTNDQQYFGNVENYASVFKSDRFTSTGTRALKVSLEKGVTIVGVREDVAFFDHGAQLVRKARINLPLAVIKEGGGFRIDDSGHPYRSLLPDAAVDHDGANITVRKISFFLRRIEVTLAFENRADDFITFLPYGRSVLRDEQGVYRLYETRDWLLTDRRLFLGLRLARGARYTGQLNFASEKRLDDQKRIYSLVVAPALREGGDQPLAYALPPIAVPAP